MTDPENEGINLVPSETPQDRRRDRWNEQAAQEILQLEEDIRGLTDPKLVHAKQQRINELWSDVLCDWLTRLGRKSGRNNCNNA